MPVLLCAQETRLPATHHAKPTPKGVGRIDSRVDNMRYWKKMADSGFVYVTPVMSVPPAIYKGSIIESQMVMSLNSPDVPTTTVNSTQSENSVFVNPIDNLNVMNSNNSTQNPVGSLYGADYLISEDGGTTWGGSVNGAGGGNSGDPTTAIGLSGRKYINFIDDPGGQGIAYSDDDVNWLTATVALNPGSLADKNHMWIDNKFTSNYEGNIYVAWTDFGGTDDTEIKISGSTDNGATWSTPLNISSAVNATSHNQGVNLQTGPNGEVYATWAVYDGWPTDETALGFAKSTNGGVSFGSATRIISNIRGIRTTETSKDHRVNSFPSMAVDISNGPNSGNIYIVWTNIGVPGVNTGSDIDIYLIRSTDNGSTWSSPIRVNNDPSGLGKQHYFPWITCDPVNGNLSVIFYDDRNVSSTMCEVYVANSFDAGNTWENFRISDVAFTPTSIPGLASGYFGDYLGITAVGTRVYPTWTDNRTGTALTYMSPYILTRLPVADFSASTLTPCLNQTMQFTDSTFRNPVSWYWSFYPSTVTFMNGTSQNSQNPQVSFNNYGNYSVQLIASNTYGSDTLLRPDYISVNASNADFIASPTQVVIDNEVLFTDQSTCNITSYSWDFGSDATPAAASTQGPHTVSYSATGFKTVTLTVNGNVTKTKTDYIEVLPEQFNMSNTNITICSGTFYDPQGPSDYLNNLDYTMTFYPADTSQSLQFEFSVFDLENEANCGYDYLKIYNGPSTSSTLLGTWCGSSFPGTIVSSHSSGALTFVFHSDVSVTGQGWMASISCVPTPLGYCPAGSTYTGCDEYISRVQIGTIDNQTGCSSPGGYGNYTSLSTKVSPSVSFPVSVTNGKPYSSDQCGIWADWNYDGDFSDPDETIIVSGTPGGGPYTANLTPPANAHKGDSRLRIRITFTGAVSSCGTTTYGEVEDYSLYVGTPGLWTGGTPGAETSWNTAGNWDDGRIPSISTDVIIPSGVTYYPEISGVLNCQDLQIKDGAEVLVQPGGVLSVTGDLIVGQGSSGSLVIDGGSCVVYGIIAALPGGNISVLNGGFLNDYY